MSDQEYEGRDEISEPPQSDQESAYASASESTAGTSQPKSPASALTPGGGDADPHTLKLEGAIWQGRTDWRFFTGICIWCVIGIVIACSIVIYAATKTSLTGGWAFLICLMITALVTMGVGAWIVLQIIRTRYRLTDQRLFIERGVFSQTIDQIELIRVDDVRLRKKFIDRLVGLGSVELLTTDTSDAHLIIEGIRNPEEIAEHVRTRMRELRSRSLFIENL
ncbi:MAG: PH domain-containing protein [Phycisphaerae bacterium]